MRSSRYQSAEHHAPAGLARHDDDPTQHLVDCSRGPPACHRNASTAVSWRLHQTSLMETQPPMTRQNVLALEDSFLDRESEIPSILLGPGETDGQEEAQFTSGCNGLRSGISERAAIVYIDAHRFERS